MKAPAWLLVCALAALAASACGGTRATWSPTAASRYDRLPPEEAIRFDGACATLERGEVTRARELLLELAERQPEHIAIGLWLQEAELRVLMQQGRSREEALADLRERWTAAAQERPSPRALVLAARLAPGPVEALELLSDALELDPACAWAHYGRASVLMGERRWSEARDAIAAALRAEPGHLRARRLEATMLARAGSASAARRAHEHWLAYAQDDPTIDRRILVETRIDLALLELLDGEARGGRARLEEIGVLREDPEGEARRLLALAACEQALGRIDEALEATRRARLVAPRSSLARVQEALLLEHWKGDPEAAADVWREVVELSKDEAELSALLERMRAQVHVERAADKEP